MNRDAIAPPLHSREILRVRQYMRHGIIGRKLPAAAYSVS